VTGNILKLNSFQIMKKILFAIIFLAIANLFAGLDTSFAQVEREDDPRTWTYFQILARAQDDSVFIKLQDDLFIDPKLESYIVVVNIMDPEPLNQYVVIGDEASPDAQRYAWSQLSEEVQQGLINWTGSNKENLNIQRLNYASVFTDVFRKIRLKDVINPPGRLRDIGSTTAYINPYFQIFGGDPTGIPFKRSIGLSFNLGTPYSGPMETDLIGGSFHILGFSLGVTTRIKEFVKTRRNGQLDTSETSIKVANYNNLFAPELGFQISYVIPFGNFFEIGYYTVLDTGSSDRPEVVYYEGTTTPMPNNVISGSYTNYEFRYPLRVLGSTRAKVYFAQYLGEKHIGFLAREMRLAGSIFDVRIDATLHGERNFQLLAETMISNIAEGFALSSFAIGPSVRLGTTKSDNFGVLTVLLNMRLKLGDYFDENIR
jgi:hypothetical protein